MAERWNRMPEDEWEEYAQDGGDNTTDLHDDGEED